MKLRLMIVSVFFMFLGAFGSAFAAAAPGNSPKKPAAAAAAADQTLSIASFGQLPLHFEANQGQSASDVRFLARGRGYLILLTPDGASLGLRKPKPGPDRGSRVGRSSEVDSMRMKLVGANPKPEITGVGELPGKSHYFIGNDPNNWKTDISNFSGVQYVDVYPGIHLLYYGNQNQLEYDFIVAAGADPKRITLRFDGVDSEEIEADGHLVLHLGDSQVKLETTIYQEINGVRQAVLGGYTLKGGHQVGFQVGDYDKTQPLVIDPVLVYSTYLGGGSDDRGAAIALDSSSNIYITGYTISSNFPTANALQPNFHNVICHPFVSPSTTPCHDAFITKIDSSGSFLIYSTYFGGSGWDDAFGIAADPAGNAYVTGTTFSSDFPTMNAVQPTFKGADSSNQVVVGDAFVAKFNPTGSQLVYSTYLGSPAGASPGRDAGAAIAVDASGNAYVTGYAGDGFPLLNPVQPTFGGGLSDVFVTKLSPGGALVFSTYLGGNTQDQGAATAIDASSNVYIAGSTFSTNYPTVNPLYTDGAAFVTKLNAAGNAVAYSTRIHGTRDASGIAVDGSGNAYLSGSTTAADFPTVNAFQPTFGGGTCSGNACFDAFVMKLNAAGSAVLYSTYLGGNNNDAAADIAVDTSGNAYVVGSTSSGNFPTLDALQTTLRGVGDGFVSKLDASGALVYSTYIGGSDVQFSPTVVGDPDSVSGIALDGKGNAFIVGSTASTDFPTANAFQASPGGGYDVFIAKIADASPVDAGFAAQDIGAVAAAGSSSFLNGTFTVKASGDDIWGFNDSFRFVSEALTGDGQIIARLVSLQNTNAWAKAGVMIRESTASNAAHAFMALTPGNGARFQRRQTTGTYSLDTPGPAVSAPYWVKLVRTGNTFTGSVSTDGVNWTVIASDTVTMSANALIGLAVTSHNNGVLTTAVFDNVSVNGGGSPPPPPPPPPGNFVGGDVGTVAAAGSDTSSNGTFTVKASGDDIWGFNDAFRFVSQSLTGDGQIVARLASLQNTNAWAKAGVMIRESTASNAAHAFMALTPGNGAHFQRRQTTGTYSVDTPGPAVSAPYWVKLVRSGNTFTGSVSTDGVNWTVVASDTVTMSANARIGLAVTSHNNGVLTTAVFDNVSVNGGGSPPPPPPGNLAGGDVGSVAIAGSDSSSNGTFTVKASGDDIWGFNDAFRFVSQGSSGDGQIVARLASLQNTNAWAKAGVMIRESTASNSAHAFMGLTPGNGAHFQERQTTGTYSLDTPGPAVAAPYWVRLVRSGNTFTGSVSTDGVNWTVVASDTATMSANALIGLAVTSHNNGVLTTAVFDNITITTAVN